MEVFKQMIIDNWQIILNVGLVLVSLILLIIKKPVRTDLWNTIMSQVLYKLPQFIKEVEVPGNGMSKKIEVISKCLLLFEKLMGRKLTVDEQTQVSTICSTEIESILECPEKKGD